MDSKIPLPWWRKRIVVISSAVLIALAFVVAAVSGLRGISESALRVPNEQLRIVTVKRGLFRDVVPIRGNAQSRDVLLLDAVAGGQVDQILARPGDRVTKGQAIIILKNTQLELEVLNNAGRLIESITQLESFETQLENNRAQNNRALADIRFNITTLERDSSRIEPLVAKGFYPAKDAIALRDQLDHFQGLLEDQRTTNLRQETLRQQQLPRLRAEQDTLRKSIDATHAQLDNLTVRAPADGVLTKLDLRVGQNRDRGERLAEISADGGFIIRAAVDEFYLTRMAVGQTGTVVHSGKAYSVQVTRIFPEIANGAFTIELTFVGREPPALTPGLSIEGQLALGEQQAATLLPSGPFLDAMPAGSVFVLIPDGSEARRTPVSWGRRNAFQVEIRSGLKPGDRVIVSDYSTYDRISRIDITS